MKKPPTRELFNRNGDEMCHYVGCRKHVQLVYAHGGLFCHPHQQLIATLNNLKKQLSFQQNYAGEYAVRLEEVRCRKIVDRAHLNRVLALEKQYQLSPETASAAAAFYAELLQPPPAVPWWKQ
jgi:hypothetical protein